MNKRRVIWIGAAVLAVAGIFGLSVAGAKAAGFSCATSAFQGPLGPGGHGGPRGQFGPGGPGGFGRIFRELNLTDAQKEQVKTLHEKARTDSEALREQLPPLREQMRAVVEAATFDENAAKAIIAKETAIQSELQLLRVRTESAVFNVLTAEQKAKLAEIRKNHPGPGRR
jgi:protein CpxP